VEGFGPKQAQAVWEFFHRPEAAGPPAAADAAAVTEAEIDAALAEEERAGA
jgi:hypothetical protein